MSAISTYKEPKDILFKLLREGRRTWLSNGIEEKSDHFFNYCVTAHSLRDWCIKHLQLSGIDVDLFHKEMNSLNFLAECRDIANSSKHFKLTDTLVSSAFPTQSEFATITGEEHQIDYEITKRLDIEIALSNGSAMDLFRFLHHTSSSWIDVLRRKGIPTEDGFHTIYMFIEYR